MTCESDKSDASTSASDDESIMEQHEYERKRELYLSKIIFCERKYQEIKPALLRQRLKQIEVLQDSILNHKSEFYLTRKAVLDNEFDTKRKHIQILRQLRKEALWRRIVGDRHNAEVSFHNNKALIKEAIRESIQQKYEKLRHEQQEVERLTGLSFGVNGGGDFESVMTEHGDKHLVTVNIIENYIINAGVVNGHTNNSKNGIASKPLWSDIPVLISQLPKQKIDEDLQMFNSMENFLSV